MAQGHLRLIWGLDAGPDPTSRGAGSAARREPTGQYLAQVAVAAELAGFTAVALRPSQEWRDLAPLVDRILSETSEIEVLVPSGTELPFVLPADRVSAWEDDAPRARVVAREDEAKAKAAATVAREGEALVVGSYGDVACELAGLASAAEDLVVTGSPQLEESWRLGESLPGLLAREGVPVLRREPEDAGGPARVPFVGNV